MTNDFESALKELFKNIVEEVAPERAECFFSPATGRSDESFLLKPREAAERLAISERHLYQLTRSGALRCVHVGRCVRYSVETIQKWVRELESKELPRAKGVTVEKGHAGSATDLKERPKRSGRVIAGRSPAKNPHPVPRRRPKSRAESAIRIDGKKAESEERHNPFSDLLNELGVNRNNVPPITNGDVMRIAEVDIPTLHGWVYLNRQLPEAAQTRLRKHFGAYRKDDNVDNP